LLTIYKALDNTLSSDKILSQKQYVGNFGIIVFYLQQIAKRATNDVRKLQSISVKGLRIFSF